MGTAVMSSEDEGSGGPLVGFILAMLALVLMLVA
jgi:hypothetical protein